MLELTVYTQSEKRLGKSRTVRLHRYDSFTQKAAVEARDRAYDGNEDAYVTDGEQFYFVLGREKAALDVTEKKGHLKRNHVEEILLFRAKLSKLENRQSSRPEDKPRKWWHFWK